MDVIPFQYAVRQKTQQPVTQKISRRIESCFADLTRQGIEHTLARSLGGLQMNIETIMLPHNLEIIGMLQTRN